MQSYKVGLVPGPVTVPDEYLAVYRTQFGSADLEDEFFALYERCAANLGRMLETENQVTIQLGEGMLALWGALKSVLKPGDRVLAVANGLFGYGIASMAESLGARVEIVGSEYDTVPDPEQVRARARLFQPALITAVHCETPSGTLMDLGPIGSIAREVDALFYVDFVASAGGVAVPVDDWQIDLGLLGSQKVLSLLPDLSMVSVSERAWTRVGEVGYIGYDALAPWRRGPEERYLPYTHSWHALAALDLALTAFENEGAENAYARHARVAALCRKRLQEMGLRLFAETEEIASPTVTAVHLPDAWSWEALDRALRKNGMAVGGNYGPLAGKVFRIGHMGSQADEELVRMGMDLLESVLKEGT